MIAPLVQILLDRTKMMPGRVMVTLVVTGNVLGWLGLYEPFLKWAGAGAGVPLLGFGNTLWKGVAKAVGEEGAMGIFKGGLTAASAGIAAALVFGYLGALVFKRRRRSK
ncbi:MAG: SpoVA/SpoVAEb family sporulation membrane protein [Clostridium sp.]